MEAFAMNLTEQIARDGNLLTRPTKSGPKPRNPLRRSVRVKKVSKKRAKEGRDYSVRRKAFLEAHPWCQIWMKREGVDEEQVHEAYAMYGLAGHAKGTQRGTNVLCTSVFSINLIPLATDVHHVRGRGRFYLDESTWLAASRTEHEWAHSHPKEARALGIIA